MRAHQTRLEPRGLTDATNIVRAPVRALAAQQRARTPGSDLKAADTTARPRTPIDAPAYTNITRHVTCMVCESTHVYRECERVGRVLGGYPMKPHPKGKPVAARLFAELGGLGGLFTRTRAHMIITAPRHPTSLARDRARSRKIPSQPSQPSQS